LTGICERTAKASEIIISNITSVDKVLAVDETTDSMSHDAKTHSQIRYRRAAITKHIYARKAQQPQPTRTLSGFERGIRKLIGRFKDAADRPLPSCVYAAGVEDGRLVELAGYVTASWHQYEASSGSQGSP
jgi:hypothetical protein